MENKEYNNKDVYETTDSCSYFSVTPNPIPFSNVEGLEKITEKVIECLDSDRTMISDLYKKHFFVLKLVQLGFFFTNLFFLIILFVYVWNKH